MRVLVDTSVWVRHFRSADAGLQALLAAGHVLVHPFVIGEIACGTPPQPRERTLADLRRLPRADAATFDDVLALIEGDGLFDTGCGYVDLTLLASTLVTPGAVLWTRDLALDALARRYGVTPTW